MSKIKEKNLKVYNDIIKNNKLFKQILRMIYII